MCRDERRYSTRPGQCGSSGPRSMTSWAAAIPANQLSRTISPRLPEAGSRSSISVTAGGSKYCIEPLLADTGTTVGCVGAAMDVTTQRETTQKLQPIALAPPGNARCHGGWNPGCRSAGPVASLQPAISDAMACAADARQNVATMPRSCLLFADQLDDPEAFLMPVRDLYASPEQQAFDVLRFKDGRVFERHSMPQLVDSESVGRVWSFRDVTDRERLLHRATFLADAARLLSSLDVKRALSSVAHLAVPVSRRDLRSGSDPRAQARTTAGRWQRWRFRARPGGACRSAWRSLGDLHRGLTIAHGDSPDVQGRGPGHAHPRGPGGKAVHQRGSRPARGTRASYCSLDRQCAAVRRRAEGHHRP